VASLCAERQCKHTLLNVRPSQTRTSTTGQEVQLVSPESRSVPSSPASVRRRPGIARPVIADHILDCVKSLSSRMAGVALGYSGIAGA
jgi:hypothetical protein